MEKRLFPNIIFCYFPKGNQSFCIIPCPKSKLIVMSVSKMQFKLSLYYKAYFIIVTHINHKTSDFRNYLKVHPYCTGGDIRLNSPEHPDKTRIHTAQIPILLLFTPFKRTSYIYDHTNYVMYFNCEEPIKL